MIGLVGTPSSGKGVLVDYLRRKGFLSYSLSDCLRGILTSLGLGHERINLMRVGNELRSRFGDEILARGAQRFIEDSDHHLFAIDSIRHPEEVRYLQMESNALMVGVVVPPEKQFELIRSRRRPGDPQTWEEFLQMERQELGLEGESHGLRVADCLKLADVTLKNEGTPQDLELKFSQILCRRGIELEGPMRSKERL